MNINDIFDKQYMYTFIHLKNLMLKLYIVEFYSYDSIQKAKNKNKTRGRKQMNDYQGLWGSRRD